MLTNDDLCDLPEDTVRIPLNKGQFALADADDEIWLNQYIWKLSPNGYACRPDYNSEKPRVIMMHRQILQTPKGMCSDHINRDRLDNRRCNLRICTSGQNSFNQGKQGYGKTASNYRGVSWKKEAGKWQAQIFAERKFYYIGVFNTEHEAAMAYNEKAKELYGEFAGLNEINLPADFVPTPPKKYTSQYKGVIFHKISRKWLAKIRINYKQFHIGLYDTEIEAAIAYNERAAQLGRNINPL